MDESQYQKIADGVFRRLEDLFRDVDTDLVDCERAGDVITLLFADGKKCILNTQRPTKQIWMAANSRALHFSYDENKSEWLDDKGQGKELFTEVRAVVKSASGLEV